MTLDERFQHALDHGYGSLHRGRVIPIISGGSDNTGDGAEDAEGSGSGSGDGGASTGTGGEEGSQRTMTQAQVDKVVQERLARERQKYADYDDLKTKAAELDQLKDSQKTELERLTERAAAAERERDEARLAAQESQLRSSILGAAAGKLADPTDAIALIDRSQLEFSDDGSPKNVESLIETLLDAKPHLAAGGSKGSADQGARGRGGAPNQVTRDQLRTMTDGDYMKAKSEGRLTSLLSGDA